MAERPDDKVYAALTAGSPSAVEAVVGDRIYPVRVPSGKSLPAIAYKRIDLPLVEFTLNSNVPSHQIARYEIWCVAIKHRDAETLGDLIEALDVYGIQPGVNRRSEQGEAENAPYASIVTVDVDVL